MPNEVGNEGTETGPAPGGFPRAELYEVLASERRRTVLAVLATASLPMDAAALAAAVADRESGTDRDRVLVSLYHVHLPMLAAADVIEYDRSAQSVTGVDEPVVDAVR